MLLYLGSCLWAGCVGMVAIGRIGSEHVWDYQYLQYGHRAYRRKAGRPNRLVQRAADRHSLQTRGEERRKEGGERKKERAEHKIVLYSTVW
jgi:hypothetical protein